MWFLLGSSGCGWKYEDLTGTNGCLFLSGICCSVCGVTSGAVVAGTAGAVVAGVATVSGASVVGVSVYVMS